MWLQTGPPPAGTLSIMVYPTAHKHPEIIATRSIKIISPLSFLLRNCLNHDLKLVTKKKEIFFKSCFLFCLF